MMTGRVGFRLWFLLALMTVCAGGAALIGIGIGGHEEPAPKRLTVSELSRIRKCIDRGDVATATEHGNKLPIVRLVIPHELSAAYHKSPAEVLQLLLDIIEGANPETANVAYCYATALEGEGGKRVAARLVWADVSGYDKLIDGADVTHRAMHVQLVSNQLAALEEAEQHP
ncbi:hypothetical protein [Aeoliella sp.]|uniref:hypothetical protein n=1 Tax=Aeoliella sp. TaxID=2795800 RepID=UPI003CCBC681